MEPTVKSAVTLLTPEGNLRSPVPAIPLESANLIRDGNEFLSSRILRHGRGLVRIVGETLRSGQLSQAAQALPPVPDKSKTR
jgi:hypothetical protein